MRGFTPDERHALSLFAHPCRFDATTPDGSRIDETMRDLIARGCVVYQRWADDTGTSFGLTELGRMAARLSHVDLIGEP